MIVILTISGHTVTMDTVTVAQLKARLSHYLREVRTGASFTVVSRDIPVAILGPYDPGLDDDVVVVPPRAGEPPLSSIDMGPPFAVGIDAVELVRQGRHDAADGLAEPHEPRRRPPPGRRP